ncbi:hypothetical protein P8452_31603 [Trifolium repens]|nr:hypothetical protein P8452_31603 [Trifolium repens]
MPATSSSDLCCRQRYPPIYVTGDVILSGGVIRDSRQRVWLFWGSCCSVVSICSILGVRVLNCFSVTVAWCFDVECSVVILMFQRWFWQQYVAPATVSVVSVAPVRLLVGTEMDELVVGVVVWWW